MTNQKIEIEKPEHIKGTEQARHDFAKVTGKEMVLKPPVFLHIESGQYYCNILGGLAYPTAENPGVVIIIGVQNDPVVFRILETYESANVFELIKKAVTMRNKYGYGLDLRILPHWYGDQEKFQTLIIKTSEVLEKKYGHERGFYVKDMVDIRERHAFPLYVRQIFNCAETKRLDISEDKVLTVHLQSFQRQDAEKGKTEDFPAIGLLGGIVHSLQIQKPWLEDVVKGEAFNL